MVIRRKSKQKRNRSPKRRTSRSKVASKRTSRRKKTSRRKSKKKTSRKRKSLRKKKSLRRKSIKGGSFFGCLGDRCSKNKKEWEEGAIEPAGYDPDAIRVRAVQGAASWRTPDGDVPWGDWEELEPVHRRSWIAARNSRASQRQD